MENMKNVKMLITLIIFSQLLTSFVGRSLSPFSVYIGESFQLTNFQIGFLPTALFLGQFLATLPMGVISDYIATHKLLLLLMITVGSGFLLLSTIQQGFIWALFFIMLAGLGYGAMHPITNKMIIQLYPLQKISLQMGLKQMSITLGSALTSIILLAFAEKLGWKIVLSGASIGLICFAIVVYFFMKPHKETFQSFRSTESSLSSQLKKLIASKLLFFTTGTALVLMGLQITFNTYLLLFLTDIKGWAIYLAGIALACSELFGALGRVMWGTLSDSIFKGNRWIGLMIITAWFPIALGLLYVSNHYLIIIMIIVSIGFTLSGFNGVWMILAVESVPKSISGSASGYSVTFASVGVFIIPPVFGYISDSTNYFYAGLFMVLISLLCLLMIIWVIFNKNKYEVNQGKS